MTQVTITISRNQVLADMKVKSHAEVATIEDPKVRYLVELGSERAEEAHQSINDAAGEVLAQLHKVTAASAEATGTDTYDNSSDISIDINVSSRTAPGLGTALAKVIHDYIVDSALSKYYVSVSRDDMATRHLNMLPRQLAMMEQLIYTKVEPTYTVS